MADPIQLLFEESLSLLNLQEQPSRVLCLQLDFFELVGPLHDVILQLRIDGSHLYDAYLLTQRFLMRERVNLMSFGFFNDHEPRRIIEILNHRLWSLQRMV